MFEWVLNTPPEIHEKNKRFKELMQECCIRVIKNNITNELTP